MNTRALLYIGAAAAAAFLLTRPKPAAATTPPPNPLAISGPFMLRPLRSTMLPKNVAVDPLGTTNGTRL